MTIDKRQQGAEVEITVSGRLDSATAPQLEKVVKQSTEGVTTLIFDFAQLDYISSAGLRVLLAAQKALGSQGDVVVRHANETILEVFELTGFSETLTIEE